MTGGSIPASTPRKKRTDSQSLDRASLPERALTGRLGDHSRVNP
jgi:hypothetical protein